MSGVEEADKKADMALSTRKRPNPVFEGDEISHRSEPLT
jgi:hypothetical protein